MDDSTTKEAVTVIGMGAMGRSLAAALLAGGHPVTVWNRTSGRADELVEAGASEAADVVDAVEASDIVLVCVLDTPAVRDIVDAAGDALRGRTIVNLATATPQEARTIGAEVVAHGGKHLDGAMMAVPAMIGRPDAMVLYGGSADAHARHRAVLLALAGNSPFLGEDAGLPAVYDVALLTLLYTTMTGWLQAYAVVDAAGVTARDFLPYAKSWFDNVVVADDPAVVADAVDQRSYPDTVPSSLGLNAAGLRMLRQAQRDIGVDSTIVDAISVLADRRVADGHGDDGYTSLVEAIRSPRSRPDAAA